MTQTAIEAGPRGPAQPARRNALLRGAQVAVGLRLFAHGAPSTAAPPDAAAGPRFAAAWDAADGRHAVGMLGLADGALSPGSHTETPTRAHGLLALPGGELLALARRPGEWLLRWHPTHGALQWLWNTPERRFQGHAVLSAHGPWLHTVESDLDSGQGLLVRRELRSLRALDAWPTGDVDAHQVLRLPDGDLLVANGGVPTQAETGRARGALDGMASSLVRLDGRSGAVRGRWRLDDPRLSMRHLAQHADGTVGIALQAEHERPEARNAAVLLALWNGDTLRLADAPPDTPLAGYGGDIAATAAGFAVSATRADAVACWDAQGRWQGQAALAGACALSGRSGGPSDALWVCGARMAGALRAATTPATSAPLSVSAGLRVDNHWLLL